MIKKLLNRLFPSGQKEGFNERAIKAFEEALAKAHAKGEQLDEFRFTESGFGWSKSRTWTYKGW